MLCFPLVAANDAFKGAVGGPLVGRLGFILMIPPESALSEKNPNNTRPCKMYQPPNRADQFRYGARTGLVLVFFFGALLDPECPPVMVLSAPVHINILGLQKPKGPFRCNKVSSMG